MRGASSEKGAAPRRFRRLVVPGDRHGARLTGLRHGVRLRTARRVAWVIIQVFKSNGPSVTEKRNEERRREARASARGLPGSEAAESQQGTGRAAGEAGARAPLDPVGRRSLPSL